MTTYDGVAQSGRAIKGKLYSDVHEFITGGDAETSLESFGSIDPSLFDSGVWTHQFLNVNNYHRLHMPIAGQLIYMRHIKGGTRLKSEWKQVTKGTILGEDARTRSLRPTCGFISTMV